ncbi:MAG: hypothetical protein GXP63_01155 [DPANN group archaeon]|nr:hypothetical protein [DPANN group archaeon]
MSDFSKILRELKLSVESIWVFDILLNTGLIFLATFLLLSIFTFISLAAVVPALVYLLVALYVRFSGTGLREVEDHDAVLKERLRTAAQYRRHANPIVDELKREVMAGLRRFRLSVLLDSKRLTLKVGVLLLLIFSLMFVSFLQEGLFPMKEAIRDSFRDMPRQIGESVDDLSKNALAMLQNSIHGETTDGDKEPLGTVSDEVIRDNTVASLGNDVIDLVINDFGFELDLKNEADYADEQFRSELPVELYATAAKTYAEKIDEDERVVVKNYFTSLANN